MCSDHLGYISLTLSGSLQRSLQMSALWSQELWSRWRRRISAGGQWRWWKRMALSVPINRKKCEYLNKCVNNEKRKTITVLCNVSIPQHTGSTFPPRSWQTSWRNQQQRRQKVGDLDWRVLPQWTMGLGLVRSRKMPQNWRWRQYWHMTSTSLDPAKDN